MVFPAVNLMCKLRGSPKIQYSIQYDVQLTTVMLLWPPHSIKDWKNKSCEVKSPQMQTEDVFEEFELRCLWGVSCWFTCHSRPPTEPSTDIKSPLLFVQAPKGLSVQKQHLCNCTHRFQQKTLFQLTKWSNQALWCLGLSAATFLNQIRPNLTC